MPAFFRYRRHRVPLRRLPALLGALLLAATFFACGGGRLTTNRTYTEIKPKHQLPERQLRNLPENLYVRIENVADAGKSYRNYVVLYVNGREISPVEKISNFTSTYTYPMRLQHGLYEVKAEYHVVGFWREQVYDILPDEPVKVLPDHRTVLIARLDKDHKGRPRQKVTRFQLSYEKLTPEVTEPTLQRQSESRPIITTPAPPEKNQRPFLVVPQVVPQRRSPRIGDESIELRPVPSPTVPEKIEPPVPDTFVMLQINTSPSGADVIVDDRYYGQSPVKVAVEKGQSHVVQVSRPGHQEIIKMLDANELRDQSLVQLLIKLEADEGKEK